MAKQKGKRAVPNTIAGFLREDGWHEGFAEGFAVGLAEARLIRQLELKFGDLTEVVRCRISEASLQQIEQWAEGMLHAKTLDDLFGETETI